MPGFDLLITWAASGFPKALTNGYSQGSGCHLGSPLQRQLPVFHYMNLPFSESVSCIDSYCFSTYGHRQEAQKPLGQKETGKQQSLFRLDVGEDSWYNLQRKNTTGLANLALWEPWTKPHSLGPHLLGLATLWCSQRQKVEGNDCVLTAMKSSQGATSTQFGYQSPTGGTSEAGRWRDDITDKGHWLLVYKKKSKILQQTHHRSLYESQGEIHKEKPLRCS